MANSESSHSSLSTTPFGTDSSALIEKEWERLAIAKKRLALQKERLTLDLELIKAEKRNLKKSNKLAQRASSRNDGVEAVQKQLVMAQRSLQQQEEECHKLRKRLAEQTQQNGNADQDEAMKDLTENLAATQRSLAALFVERDEIRRERDDLKEKLDQQQSEPAAPDKRCDNLQYKIDELEDSLQKMKTVYASAQAQHATEKKKFREEMESSRTVASGIGEELSQAKLLCEQLQTQNDQLKNENTVLQSELIDKESQSVVTENEEIQTLMLDLQKDNERLKKTLSEQARELDDMKLLVPRNRILLDQAQSKNGQLQGELENMRKKYSEQEELVQEIQMTKEALVQKGERQEAELQKLRSEKDKISVDFSDTKLALESQNMELREELKKKALCTAPQQDGTAATTPSVLSAGMSTIIIPSDLDTPKQDKKHVIEWEWEGDALAGIYTGWMDLVGDPDGHGTLRIDDGSIYDGEWSHGERHGGLPTSFCVLWCMICWFYFPRSFLIWSHAVTIPLARSFSWSLCNYLFFILFAHRPWCFHIC